MIHAIHPHPTLSEAMGEAAMALHGRAIHFFQDSAKVLSAARAR